MKKFLGAAAVMALAGCTPAQEDANAEAPQSAKRAMDGVDTSAPLPTDVRRAWHDDAHFQLP